MPEGKRELREAVRRARQNLATAYRQKASAAMLAKLFELEIYRQASSVMAYCPMAEEVQLTPLLKHSLFQGKTVALPYVISKGLMGAVKLHDMDSLVEGADGILTVGEEKREFLSPGLLDLVVVPGVAFGLDGSRLGMGAGFVPFAEGGGSLTRKFHFTKPALPPQLTYAAVSVDSMSSDSSLVP